MPDAKAAGVQVLPHGPVSGSLLSVILEPYKPHCRYLKTATVGYGQPIIHATNEQPEVGAAQALGRFSIPEPCYIQDTGHFNAVEFNICYNQLGYLLMAQCIADERVLDRWCDGVEGYRERMLSDILILDYHSRFQHAMRSDDFEGAVTITSVRESRKLWLVKMHCGFHDADGGQSDGDILLGLLKRPGAS